MKKVQLECWEEFESEVSAIHKALEERRVEMQMHISSLLFRGHAQECWRLKTALERYSGRVFSLTDYYRIMLAVQPAVESLTSKCWNLPYVSKIDEEYYGPPPGYEFMIYLGHHGFPSPLLDWTRSSYVAAFFAFHPHPDKREGNVAIYSYIEHYGHGKGSFHSEGMIIGLGPSVRTHKRHFIQQSEYTICKKFDGERYVYYNHEEVFKRKNDRQDILTKYFIPKTERSKVLKKLDFMNINSYSLFGDEDSLMTTLAYREIEQKGFGFMK